MITFNVHCTCSSLATTYVHLTYAYTLQRHPSTVTTPTLSSNYFSSSKYSTLPFKSLEPYKVYRSIAIDLHISRQGLPRIVYEFKMRVCTQLQLVQLYYGQKHMHFQIVKIEFIQFFTFTFCGFLFTRIPYKQATFSCVRLPIRLPKTSIAIDNVDKVDNAFTSLPNRPTKCTLVQPTE